MNRRDFIKSTGAGIVLGAGGLKAGAAGSMPNVLLIIVDQMRLPCWFHKQAHLPAFERLRGEGLSFSNHFVSAVPCSPSRACLFTGLHQPQHGIHANIGTRMTPDGSPSLDPGLPSLGHFFRKAGYRTPYFGKWHLTTKDDFKHGRLGLSDYGFEEWQPPDRIGMPYEGLRRDAEFADQTIEWLVNNGKQGPWFLTCSLINPHDIMYYSILDVPTAAVPDVCEKIPDNFHDDLIGKPSIQTHWKESWGKFFGTGPNMTERECLHYLDFYYYLQLKVEAQIERVLDALDRLGLADDTLLVFTSDHGEMAGSHGLMGKGPFMYQENNNVPLIVRWPGRVEAGARTDALSQNVDVLPTLLDLAGIDFYRDFFPGKSMAPVITGDHNTETSDHVLMSHGPMEIPFKHHLELIRYIPRTTAPDRMRAIFDGRYKFARYFGPGLPEEYELYDLREDPLEMLNLGADPAFRALREEMLAKLLQYEKREMAPVAAS
jgi:arylsulfatase A-like enzyme